MHNFILILTKVKQAFIGFAVYSGHRVPLAPDGLLLALKTKWYLNKL